MPGDRERGNLAENGARCVQHAQFQANVQPQYIDPDTEGGRAFAEETIQMCRNLVDQFRNATDGADPGLFHYTIENALRSGENPPLGAVSDRSKDDCQ